jgi:hypothetical protein
MHFEETPFGTKIIGLPEAIHAVAEQEGETVSELKDIGNELLTKDLKARIAELEELQFTNLVLGERIAKLEAENAELKRKLSPLSSATPSYVAGLEAELAIWKMRMKALVGEDSPDMAGNRIIELKAELDDKKSVLRVQAGVIENLRNERDRMKGDYQVISEKLWYALAKETTK